MKKSPSPIALLYQILSLFVWIITTIELNSFGCVTHAKDWTGSSSTITWIVWFVLRCHFACQFSCTRKLCQMICSFKRRMRSVTNSSNHVTEAEPLRFQSTAIIFWDACVINYKTFFIKELVLARPLTGFHKKTWSF